MDLPYNELAPNEQHPNFIATGRQENLDKSYASTPALRTFHTNTHYTQGNWNALYARTSSAGHQPIQAQPATTQQTNF
jgi:hypothetical protein